MTPLRFIVPGPPKVKMRHRTSVRFGKSHVYNPDANTLAQRSIATEALAEIARRKLQGLMFMDGQPVKMKLVAYFGTDKEKRHGRPHTFKPDIDNVVKLYKDALKGVVYRDDCQVAVLEAAKLWVPTCQAGVRVQIEEIDL